jgi:hypothetical protein
MIGLIIANIIIILVTAIVAYLVGYKTGYEEGLVKCGWCGSCQRWHGNDQPCLELSENA